MRLLIALVITVASMLAQTVGFPETTLQQSITTITSNQIVLASIQAANAPGVQETQGVIGSPIGISPNTVMLSWPPPSEAYSIYQVNTPGLTNRVFARRGMYSTYPQMPAQGTLIWLGPANYFWNYNPGGSCNAPAQASLPVVTIPSGIVWNCVGGTSGTWVHGIEWQQDIGTWQTTNIQWNQA